ncbi:DnaJ domain-containing protein [Breznakiellaceae bacterium SP9]
MSIKRIVDKMPFWVSPLVGGFIGYFAGIFGACIGILMGYFLRELLNQSKDDAAVLRYFTHPGKSDFHEGEPGLAAYCALAVLIVALKTKPTRNNAQPYEIYAIELASRSACSVFSPRFANAAFVESFCRLAYSRWNTINAALLAESLASKRKYKGDLTVLSQALQNLVVGAEAKTCADRIVSVLEACEHGAYADTESVLDRAGDPWRVLGLAQDTSIDTVKSTFRRLALQFHPDSLSMLNEEQRHEATRAFMTIQNAYKEIMNVRSM